jgi:hypothetical protein
LIANFNGSMSKVNHEYNTWNNLGRRRIPKSLASSNEAN